MMYVKVIIPRPLDTAFTYTVPSGLEDKIGVGKRVLVPFGSKRFVTGIIESMSEIRPADVASFKDIADVLDVVPTVIYPQLKFWHWIADYYMCPIGDVMKAALPSGMKLESESVVQLAEDIEPGTVEGLSEKGFAIFSAIAEKGKISLKELAKTYGEGRVETEVSRLVDLNLVSVRETVVNHYRRVKVHMVIPTIAENDPDALKAAFNAVKRSAGQQKALLRLIALSGFNNATVTTKPVAKIDLLADDADITWDHFVALKKKGLAEISVREVSRFASPEDGYGAFKAPLPVLSAEQTQALRKIHEAFIDRTVTLLHGVTSSGKTEIYMHLIEHVLGQGRQVLFLVPEIALTTQLTRRLQKVFGNRVRIYHSRFTDNERIDIWRDMLSRPEPCVVIGARSAVFLPFTNLGLVIVDEEHEPSYKQYDPAPRYNGRDAAIVLASMHGARTLLGSATPTIETYYKATVEKKYGFVELTARYGDVALPEIKIIDLAKERQKHSVDGAFSDTMIAEGRNTLREGRQLIFFLNRRGFSPRARCRQCQFVPRCDHCDVALAYHKRTNTLECHYCGATYPVPKICPNCHEPAVGIEGYGTERIEDGLDRVYPEARVLRMDLDTTRNKEAYSRIIDEFSDHKADILVGTQMVTKGLDFGNVGMVGVINADNMLNFPDFRASERAFNMLEQVSGRAGRRVAASGKVAIQTYTPEHPVIGFVRSHDYKGFFNKEIEERQKFCYPPFSRVINIYVKHRDRAVVEKEARRYAEKLRQHLGNRVNGPIEPGVERISSMYIRQIMLRIETSASVRRVKDILRAIYIEMEASPEKTSATYHYDVDPA